MKEFTTASLQESFNNPEYWDLANLWMKSKALAETVREQVNAIEADILKNKVKLYNDLDMSFKERGSSRFSDVTRKRILDPKEDYQSKDEAETQRYWDLCREATAAAGLRTPDMSPEDCPALVAEHNHVKVEWKILEALDKIFETDKFDGIYGERRTKAIDLFIKAAYNHPNNNRR